MNCGVESDNQVDLNNNSNDEKISDVNRGNDLVLKLKRIILEQEEKELKNQQSADKLVNQESSKLINQESPKLDKKLITGNDKEVKSIKMEKINQTEDLNNNQPQIKETIKKLNDKVNQLDLNKTTNLTNGNVKILINGNATIESNSIDKINDKINDKSNDKSNNSNGNLNNNSNGSLNDCCDSNKPMNNSTNTNSSTSTNSSKDITNCSTTDKIEEIKIIQSKSLNNKSTKID